MITACKNYITNNGANSIWDQPQQVVVDKIKAAIHLNQVPNDTLLLFLHQLLSVCVRKKAAIVSFCLPSPREFVKMHQYAFPLHEKYKVEKQQEILPI